MDELDPESRDALRRYRDDTVLPAPARERVWQRLDASMAETRADPPTRQTPIDPPRRRAATIVVVTGLAAAALLALCDLRGRLGDTPAPSDSAAPHTAPSLPGEHTRSRTPPPREPTPEPPPPPPANTPTIEPSDDPAADRADDLAAELAHLQRARAALDRSDPDAALTHLAAHAGQFPGGQMVQDRQLLRVEALCARGDAPAARAEASAFLQRYPGSPHAVRVQSFCPDAPNPVTDRPPGGEPAP